MKTKYFLITEYLWGTDCKRHVYMFPDERSASAAFYAVRNEAKRALKEVTVDDTDPYGYPVTGTAVVTANSDTVYSVDVYGTHNTLTIKIREDKTGVLYRHFTKELKDFDPPFYVPRPIDTSDVQLPKSIDCLIEALAANTHDIWATGRLAEGWVHGETTDKAKKTHACLVFYGDLPESEKAYDRNTVVETLKVLYKLGYKVVPPS